MSKELIYLDTYVLHQYMRIRLTKSIIANMSAEKGKTQFKIFLDNEKNELILRIAQGDNDNE